MAKIFYPDFFNDVFGPIMQPGSSGGFAGPIRIGNVARALAGGEMKSARIEVPCDYGDLSQLDTFMSDRGYLGGLLGFSTEDVRVFDAYEQVREQGVSVEFGHDAAGDISGHQVRIEVVGRTGAGGSLVARSIGGGMIEIDRLGAYELGWRADTYAVVLYGDVAVLSEAASALAGLVGASFVDSRPLRAGATPSADEGAVLIELSESVGGLARALGFLGNSPVSWVELPAQLPVVTRADRKPQLFATVPEWAEYAQEQGISFVDAAICYEQAFSGWSVAAIRERFELIADILNGQIRTLEELGPYKVEETPVLPIYGRQWADYVGAYGGSRVSPAVGRPGGGPLSDSLTSRIIAYALATNAKVPGTPIVPGPMGTGGGYLFSALKAVQEAYGFSRERLIDSLIVAAGLGAIAFTHTNATGERGCVGESGVCCAMASGAVAYLAGGDAVAVERAASMALQASIGITCDPIPGGKEFPCLTRTVRAAVTAPLYADLALSGIDPVIPYHEMLQAIEQHYLATDPSLLCGSACGCNVTPAAKSCMSWLAGQCTVNR